MIKLLHLFIAGILSCSFSIPALAQEGHIGMKYQAFEPLPETDHFKKKEIPVEPKVEEKKEEVKILNPDPKTDFSELRSQGVVLIKQIIDPLRVQLQDGRIVQLTGIEIPDYDPANPGPIASKAFEQLKLLLENKQATLYQTKNTGEGQRNRMGHYLGHIETQKDKFWIQGFLLKNGLARIQPGAANTEMATTMMKLEAEAITEKRGLWADAQYGILTPETAKTAMNGWAIVEGTITKTAMSGNKIFLNFSEDYRKDFTIGVEGDARRQMSKQNIDTLKLAGKRVRVHGWVENYNGPYIKLSNAIWLEILPGAAPPANLPQDN